MIRGEVNPFRQPIIRLIVHDTLNVPAEFEATVDTGFTEFLTLTPAQIASLGLPFYGTMDMTLGDETVVTLDLYEATVEWDGRLRTIFVHAANGQIFVGMGLIEGYRLTVDGVDGGPVTIELL